MWKKKKGSRTQTNRASAINSGRLQSRTGLDSPFFGCSLFSLLLLLTPLRAAVVNVSINPETSPLQTPSGTIVPDGTALFVVSYKTTQDAFFTALRGATTAADLVAVFSNQLQFFNSTPFLKGDYGTYENPNIGWSSEGGASAEITPTTASNLPVFTLFSSSTNPFDPTASFILLKSRGTNLDSYIPKDDSPSTIEISGDSTSGSDVIFGQFFSSSGAFRMATAAAYGQITSATTLTMNAGATPSTYQILSNNGANSFGVTSLPTWASLNSATGVITLTPGASISGTFTLGLSAINSLTGTTATGSLAVTVVAPPDITSTLTATATRGIAFTYRITADNSPTSFNATGLPDGLSIDTTTGLISGTSNVAVGSFSVIISAGNAAGTDTETLVLTLQAAPDITSTLIAIATRGTAFSYQIAADNSPTSFNATGLPGGLSINTATGLISGTPNVPAGTFNVSLSAANAAGTGTATLLINLSEPIVGAPVITSSIGAIALRGTAFTYQISANSSPTSFNATGLPGGLSINTATGLISGTPNVTAGTFIVTLSATNSTGTGTATLVITLSAAPIITSTLTGTATRGTAFTYQIAADSSPASFNATGLPGGLSINTATGLISGTPNVAAGTFNVTMTAINVTGTGTATLVIALNADPVITSTLTATATRGVAFTYQIAADSSPTSFNATGLPGGLSINTTTGLISGIPNVVANTFNVTVTATNGAGTGTATLVLDLTSPSLSIPSLVSNKLTRTAGTAYSIPVTIPAGFTVDSYTFEPEITGVTYSGGNLLISSTAAPFAKGTTSRVVTLTLNRTSGLDGSKVSASLDFDLRLVAPTPNALTSSGPFEVNVGEDYSLQLSTDVSTLCPNQNIQIVGTLPTGLINNSAGLRKTGLITGKNTSTTFPYEFTVNVVADTSTFYEGGGTVTVPVIFRLRNPVAPVITSESTRLAGVGKTFAQYTIAADGAPFRFTANGLPPGIALNGANLAGTPTQAGNYDVRLEAYNSYRPGSTLTADLQSGTATLRIFVSGSKPTTATPLSGSSNLQAGTPASFSMLSAQDLGLRISGYGFPPGLTINSSTGLVTGTPTTAGTYSVTLFVQNGKGWIKKAISLTVR